MDSEPRTRRTHILLRTANVASILLCGGALVVGYAGVTGSSTARDEGALRRLTNAAGQVVAIAGSPALGHDAAPVVVVGFSDFECPFCGAFAQQTLPRLRQSHIETGKARFVFKHLPLDVIHPAARPTAVATMCAARLGEFWTVHDALFRDRRIVPARVRELIDDASPRLDVFDRCLLEPPVILDRDERDGANLGITSTPTFLLGRATGDGVRVETSLLGAVSYNDFVKEIDAVAARGR